jgi:hypothetical protein
MIFTILHCNSEILSIFDEIFGISVSNSGHGNEKGIRCNAGAVPAAVSQ